MSLTRVWEPIRIGSVDIKNRVARAAHATALYNGKVDDDFIAFHLARARGGVGLSILGAAGVHPSSVVDFLVDEANMAGYEKLMGQIRPHGMRVFQQLWHGGHIFPGLGSTTTWAPSAVPDPLSGFVGVPMGQAEIDEIVAAFGTAARRCRDAGLDGVEVHLGHGYLIAQFLSPLTNLREDGYNGALLDRCRFAIEVLKSVRAAVGDDYPVGVRVSASTAKGGLGTADVAAICAHLETLKLIDFVDISYGDYFDHSYAAATMAMPGGYQLQPNAPIARAVKLPRIATGRFRTLEEADQVLRDGEADIVSLVRAHIADPDIVRKTQAGRVEDVRPCIACNQGCFGGIYQAGRMGCVVNPAAGRERLLDEEFITRSDSPKRVAIVGGGPAGLEAARVAALRGHRVTLFEAGPHLGGKLQVARRAPHLHILGDLVSWMERQVYALGVDVRLNTPIDASDALKEKPDVLIVATGGMNRSDGRQATVPGEMPTGMALPHVIDADTLLTAPANFLNGRKTALVFDDVGRYPAVAAAEHLARAGLAVTFVTSQTSFASKMYGSFRDIESLRRLSQGPFRLLVSHYLSAVHADHCVVHARGSERMEDIAADIVVVITHALPVRELFDELRGKLPAVRLVGDALSPRDLQAAIHEGHHCARTT